MNFVAHYFRKVFFVFCICSSLLIGGIVPVEVGQGQEQIEFFDIVKSVDQEEQSFILAGGQKIYVTSSTVLITQTGTDPYFENIIKSGTNAKVSVEIVDGRYVALTVETFEEG